MVRGPSRRDPIPALEWVAAALGLLVFVAMLTVLTREALVGGGDDVPLLSARVEAVVPAGSGNIVRIAVSNRSAQTAASVQVEGRLGDETASATIDYVPGHSEARGGLIFKGDPRTGLELAVLGYELP